MALSYKQNLKLLMDQFAADPVSPEVVRLRNWKLPMETKPGESYYQIDQIKDLQTLASRYKLHGSDWFSKMDPEQLQKQLNGIIDNDRTKLRWTAQSVNPEFQIAAAIHDIEFGKANGNDAAALRANANMQHNLRILSKELSRNKFTGWWNANVHAPIYRTVLDLMYKHNLDNAVDRRARIR